MLDRRPIRQHISPPGSSTALSRKKPDRPRRTRQFASHSFTAIHRRCGSLLRKTADAAGKVHICLPGLRCSHPYVRRAPTRFLALCQLKAGIGRRKVTWLERGILPPIVCPTNRRCARRRMPVVPVLERLLHTIPTRSCETVTRQRFTSDPGNAIMDLSCRFGSTRVTHDSVRVPANALIPSAGAVNAKKS